MSPVREMFFYIHVTNPILKLKPDNSTDLCLYDCDKKVILPSGKTKYHWNVENVFSQKMKNILHKK